MAIIMTMAASVRSFEIYNIILIALSYRAIIDFTCLAIP
jgi:hypothetical protein